MISRKKGVEEESMWTQTLQLHPNAHHEFQYCSYLRSFPFFNSSILPPPFLPFLLLPFLLFFYSFLFTSFLPSFFSPSFPPLLPACHSSSLYFLPPSFLSQNNQKKFRFRITNTLLQQLNNNQTNRDRGKSPN